MCFAETMEPTIALVQCNIDSIVKPRPTSHIKSSNPLKTHVNVADTCSKDHERCWLRFQMDLRVIYAFFNNFSGHCCGLALEFMAWVHGTSHPIEVVTRRRIDW